MTNPVQTPAKRIPTVEEIRVKLATDDRWVLRGLKAIFKKQTDDEKHDGITKHDNGVGFTGADSGFLSPMALRALEGRDFSPKQMVYIRKAMKKYAGQLHKIATGKI